MTKFDINRKNLYEDLLGLGYFKDEDGTINFSFEDFNASMSEPDVARTLYSNLLSDGFYQDDQGQPTISEGEFVESLCDTREKKEYYPITENQRGLYIDWEMNRDTTQYNIPSVNRLDGVSADDLRQAIITVVNAHPYLKTRLAERDGDVVQLRLDDEEVVVSCETLSEKPDSSFFQKRVRPFDLFNDRLYRFEIYIYGHAVYLFQDIHHIIFDGGSSLVFTQDVLTWLQGGEIMEETYSAFDRAQDEYELMHSDAYTAAETYFDHLMGDYEVASYPHSSKPDTLSPSAQVERISVKSAAITEFCKKNGFTVNSFFMSVLSEVLQRILREKHLYFTSITSGRVNADMQNIMGMFVKTLPVVTCAGMDDTVKEGLMTVKEHVNAMQQQYVDTQDCSIFPYTKLVEKTGARSEILFVYQGGISDADIEVSGEKVDMETHEEDLHLNLDTVKVPISIIVQPEGASYRIEIEYDGALYNHHDMQLLLSMISSYAQQACQNGERAVCTIPLVTEEEARKLVKLSSGETLAYDENETFIDMFRQQVIQHPDSLAVKDMTSSLTYSELNRSSDCLASWLVHKGVRPNDFVAIKTHRVKEFFVAVLGVQKCSAAYVPVDPEYPQDRIDYMIEDCGAQVVLTEETIAEALNEVPAGQPLPGPGAENLAYMIYTSGSTGKPKGVMISHRALRACLAWNCKEFDLKPGKRNVNHPSFSFDASTFDLFYPLAAGAEVHVFDESIRKDMDAMANYIRENKITGMTMSTALGMTLLNQFDLPIEYIMLGGEKFMPVKKSSARLYNGYGPTEFTVCSSFHIIDQDRDVDIPIGRPVPNSLSVVCDKYGQLLPQGVPGELCLVGSQIAEGYWHRDDLTAERFTPAVFLNGNKKMYHTGDLAAWNDEGELMFMGRIDTQVKLRGFRIELGEIENVASQMDGIGSVAAEVKTLPSGLQHLCLYFTADHPVDTESLRQLMAQSLTEYMVPTAFMQMEALPMTPGGKINRKALPMPQVEQEDRVAPATELEGQLYAIVADLLKTDGFGVTSNLLSWGLSSLSAMRLSAAIHQKTGLQIKVGDIMKSPTIRDMAALNGHTANGSGLKPYPRQEYYPLTENQRGLYLSWETNPSTTQYNIPSLYQFDDMDAARLVEALRQAIDAHNYLKTRLVLQEGNVLQQRHDDEPAVVTLTTVEETPDMAALQQRVRAFDLFYDRLYRIEVIQAPDRVYLFMDIHHIIFDGLSISVFLNDVIRAYQGESVRPETYQAFDFALYEQHLADSEMMEEAERYFDSMIACANTLSLPASAVPDGTIEGKTEVAIPAAGIDAFCAKAGVTIGSYMQAAFAETMHRLTREDYPLFVTINNGRSAGVELQSCVGMFVKTLPVVRPTMDSDNPTVEAFVKAMHQQLQQSYSHDYYPYTKLVERHSIHLGVMFVYQGGLFEGGDTDFGQPISLQLDTVKFPLTFTIYPQDKHYVIHLEYDGRTYSRHDMEAIGQSFAALASGMTSCNLLSEAATVSPADVPSLLQLGRGETMDYDRTDTLVSLIQRQVRLTPDATAIVYQNTRMTYRQVDELTDRLASYLLTHYHVKPEEAVGVMIDRSELMLIYPLAIMKAGAAYMPLDFHFPEDRLQYMCEDADVRLILSEGHRVQEAMPNFKGDVVLSSVMDSLPESTTPLPQLLTTGRYVLLYTSGSTGKPKGVALEHRNIVNFCHWYVRQFRITPADRAVGYANFGFDAHMLDIYPALSTGASVYIIPSDMRLDLTAMNEYIKQQRLTIAFMTTQVGYLFATTLRDNHLRLLSIGGEKLMPLQKPDLEFYNVYGPTECTLFSTYFRVDTDYDSSLIGRPLANYQLYVVDPQMQLVPKGVAGELVVGGEGVGRGYLHPAEKDAHKFTTFRGQRCYRTGDLVRWSDDGNIEFLGRIDGQVKLRGLRIELGEIESRASQYDGIRQVCAMVIGGQTLCLYFTADKQVDVDQLKNFLGETLTEFMVPTSYMQLEVMPLTPNGKIDKKQLPEPQVKLTLENVAPRTRDEWKLWTMAVDILMKNAPNSSIPDFGITDDLVTLGMNSILAMRLAARAGKEGLVLKVNDIMKHRTIERILSNNMTLGYWINTYQPNKPVLILFHGIITAEEMVEKFRQWDGMFNIFTIEPTFEHDLYVFQDADFGEVIEMYASLLDAYIPADAMVQAFVGYSWGGEQAYCVAQRWQKIRGTAPTVYLGDSHMNNRSMFRKISPEDVSASIIDNVRKRNDVYAQTPEDKIRKEIAKILNRNNHVVDRLMSGFCFPKYDGKVRLFNARKDNPDEQTNIAAWRALAPKLEVIDVDDTHGNLYSESRYIPLFTEWLKKDMNHD